MRSCEIGMSPLATLMLRWLAITALVGNLAAAASAAAQPPIVGTVTHIKDGDILCVGVHSLEVRLEGIDAPETDESCWRGASRWKCGPPATQTLRHITTNQTLTCQPKYCDAKGRTVALCLAGGVDVSENMVAAGWAVDWPYYSQGRYSKAQDAAQKAGRGLWANSGRPTLRMPGRMFQPGTRRSRGPWPPCPARCDRTSTSGPARYGIPSWRPRHSPTPHGDDVSHPLRHARMNVQWALQLW